MMTVVIVAYVLAALFAAYLFWAINSLGPGSVWKSLVFGAVWPIVFICVVVYILWIDWQARKNPISTYRIHDR